MVRTNASDATPLADFAAVLRERIAARGLTLTSLAERLRDTGNPVSMATLSYWRSGARRPEGAQSMSAVAEIERILHLDEGALSRLVGPSLRVGPFGTPAYPLTDGQLEEAVTEVFTVLGEPDPDRVRDVTTQCVTEVGPDGAVVSRTTRSLIQAMSNGVAHVPYVELSPGVASPAPEFTILGGGEIVERYSHESGEVHGFMIALDQPIDTTETTMIEWRVTYPSGAPPTYDTGHGMSRQCRELLLWTHFHPEAIPDWLEVVEETPTDTTSRPVTLTSGRSVHQVRRRFGPGMLILRWGFDDARRPS